MSTFDDFLSQAWADHAEQPDTVAARLPEALVLVENDDHVARLTHLAHHVLGEHLHRWQEGTAYLARLASRGIQGEAGSAGLARCQASLRLCSEGTCELEYFCSSDRCRVCVMAASNLARIDSARAAALLADAVAGAGHLPDGDPGVRSLAAFSNGIAASLQELVARSEEQSTLMIRAAQVARGQWERAGSWLEVERAEYRLAVCWAAAGDSQRALQHAKACDAIVQLNGSQPLEVFFASEALAIATLALGDQEGHRAAVAAAVASFAELPREDQAWCHPTLAKLTAS